MNGTLAVFFGAAVIAAATAPFFGALAPRWGLVTRQREDRWRVRGQIPLLGGAAIALGALVTAAAAGLGSRELLVVLGCALVAFALGLLDDLRHLAPSTKLVGQVVVASLLVAGGVRVGFVDNFAVAFLLTLFWVVGMMNALNLMDNMDGLASGISVIAAGALALTAVPSGPAAVLAAATAGGALGFLAHNFHPARIFMGDAGSQFLGFLLAAAALLHTASGATNVGLALLGPLVVLAVPIFDTALVAASRGLAGRSISQGGRDHTSHRLAALGLSDRGAVLILYGVALLLAGLGVLAESFVSLMFPLLALAAIALVLFGAFLHEVNVYGDDGDDTAERDGPRMRVIKRGWIAGRFGAEIGFDSVLLTVAYYSAYLIRFEGLPEAVWQSQFIESVPVVVSAQLAALVVLGVYRTLWRLLGVGDALTIVRAVVLGTGVAALSVLLLFRFTGYSRAVFLLDAILVAALLVSLRSFLLWLRHWFTIRPRADAVRVLIVGATDRGSFALRLLTSSTQPSYRAVGFIDDDPGKRHRSVAGVRIVGTTADLDAMIARVGAQLVVLALGPQETQLAERVKARCAAVGIECRELLVPI